MRDLLDAPIEPIHEEPKELHEELNATAELTMNQQMSDNLMMGNQQQQQQDDQQGLLMLPKQTTSTMANLNTSLVDTKVAAKAEEEYPDELAGELKNESSASKKNRASKVKKASKKYNKAEAARQNKAMLSTRQRLESRNEALKNPPRDEDGEMLGNPPADLSYEEKKTYTKQEKAALEATIAEIEALSAHELAKLEAKKKFHVDKKTRNGIMLDTDTMRLQVDSLSQQKAAWKEYGSRQQLGDKEAMLVEKKMAALQKKMDSLQEKKAEILDERYRQQWVEDGNVAENGMLTSSLYAILDNKKGEDLLHKRLKNRSLREKLAPSAMPVSALVTIFTGKHKDAKAIDEAPNDRKTSYDDKKIGKISDYVDDGLSGKYSKPNNNALAVGDLSEKATETDWIEEKRASKENPLLNPKHGKMDWFQKPSIGTLKEEQAAYKKLYKEEQQLFLWRYEALDASIDAQNTRLAPSEIEVDSRFLSQREKHAKDFTDAERKAQKQEWHDDMVDGSDVCEDYYSKFKGSVFPYTAEEMEERKKIYAEVIAERGDTDSMELAQERTELMNTLGYVPSEKRYRSDIDNEFEEGEDEEQLEENEQRDKEEGAEKLAMLKELQEAEKKFLQSDPTKYVYKPPEYGLTQGRNEDNDAYAERNKKYFELHPKMDYVKWQISALDLRLLRFHNATLTGMAMSAAKKKEYLLLEKQLVSLRLKYAEQTKQFNMLQYTSSKSTAVRKGAQEDEAHEKMLKQKMHIMQGYAAQTTPHTKEFRSAMKQAEAAKQKYEDWRETCQKREAAYQWKLGAPARKAAAEKKAEREREEKEARKAEEKAQKEMPAAEKKVQQEKPAQ